MPVESALVALIPEAEGVVGCFRKRHDPCAAAGLPAHVTILSPFNPPAELTSDTIAALRALFSTLPSFHTSFAETRRFANVLYLAPAPGEPFRALTAAVVRRFPDAPPYGGAFAKVVPHLTVAQVCDPQQLEAIAADFHRAAARELPIRARVHTVALMENSTGRWRMCAQFALRLEGNAG